MMDALGGRVVAKRIVLIGAGSAQFGFGTLGDIFRSPTLAGSCVVLHDINAASLRVVESAARAFVGDRGLPFTITATTDRAEALKRADYCIISIEVGDRFALWEQDWRIPQQYGIRQVYGENGGPGGLFHSLRIVPPILEICADVQRICPEAYVFNYSNPMSRICTTVKRKFPEMRFIGLCHEIASVPQHLPRMLETPLENLEFRAGGLNHFSVLLSVRYRDTGRDAYPDVRRKAAGYFESLPELRDIHTFLAAEGRLPSPVEEQALRRRARPWSERGLFRTILETYGYLPITTDSHFGEYIQWAHEVVDHKGILDFYSWYKEYCQKKPEARIRVTEDYEERVVPIIEDIIGDSGHEESAVNILNDGAIDNLPGDIVVEVPAIVGGKGIAAVRLGQLPRGFAGLLLNQVAVHDLTAEAILHSSRDLALQALLADPVVDSYRAAEQTLAAILSAQKPYLGYLT